MNGMGIVNVAVGVCATAVVVGLKANKRDEQPTARLQIWEGFLKGVHISILIDVEETKQECCL